MSQRENQIESQNSQSKTWWGQRFIEALTQFTDSGRLARGKAYNSDHRILSWEIKSGKINATVRGNKNAFFGVTKEPRYKTQLSLTPISTADWKKLVKQMSSKASIISRLMLDEMPDNIENTFESIGLTLLPYGSKDFNVSCSCPDYSSSCKHIAGVCYRLATVLDHNPLLLFELRGLSLDKLQNELQNYPLGKALSMMINAESVAPGTTDSYFTRPVCTMLPESLTTHDYWYTQKPFPKIIEPVKPAVIPGLAIKKAGDHPKFWHKSTPFLEVMSEFYVRMRKGSGIK
jgi:uncharacterized Zn finger protein